MHETDSIPYSPVFLGRPVVNSRTFPPYFEKTDVILTEFRFNYDVARGFLSPSHFPIPNTEIKGLVLSDFLVFQYHSLCQNKFAPGVLESGIIRTWNRKHWKEETLENGTSNI